MTDVKKKIFSLFKQPGMASLATVTSDGKPWVRYMMIQAFEKEILFKTCTSLDSRKVAHIKNNPEVHLICRDSTGGMESPYVQIQARAEVLTDPKEKKAFWTEYLKKHFSGPDDPNYCILRFKPYRMELMASETPEIWTS